MQRQRQSIHAGVRVQVIIQAASDCARQILRNYPQVASPLDWR